MNFQKNNEKGYTLFLAVLIGVLFSVMATVLITFTTSGILKNDTAEDLQQATELSEKGLTHIMSDIHSKLQAKINEGEDGIIQDDFVAALETILENLSCKNGAYLKNLDEPVTGGYKVCIENYAPDEDANGQKIQTRQVVTFKSTGKDKDGKQKVNYSTAVVGADAVPDALNYAIGSHKVCDGTETGKEKKNCVDGEGNLFLHGGIQIEGDLKVDGNIITTDQGYAYLGKDQWIDSLYPSILPRKDSEEEAAKLVLGEKVYIFRTNPSYNSHIKRNKFNSANYTEVTNLNSAFTAAPKIIDSEPIRDIIIVSDYKEEYEFNEREADLRVDANIADVSDLWWWFGRGRTATLSNIDLGTKNVFGPNQIRACDNLWGCRDSIDYYALENINIFNKFSTNKSVKIQEGSTTINSGMYVGGNLSIGNGSESYNPNLYDKVELNGTIYVEGDLTIKGAAADLNALIYVDGSVTIENTVINGLELDNGEEGSLIVFAEEEIHIANNSVNQDDPSNIRGFFYSNDTFEMFGVGSNIRIEGGISARRIVLNAIRGRAESYYFDGAQKITNNDYFEGVNGQKVRDSRLQVIYNPGIIGTFSDLKLEEPIIHSINPPYLIDRQ
ncbi:hypothetical protein D8M04_00910 [Oceanobacillus piezotolerans]|uniref:Uncharacterized protein n=1 Tax=Oceanobacillus piezotolerans TaxID=2448030 RepID=A0A498DA66_9BACI|nr:hypothetical protein [Oceanobacillus piezotolerans]RLL47871.1 hypothetical protein D8M04_00910 [Oceanobacillus piezotolerans]